MLIPAAARFAPGLPAHRPTQTRHQAIQAACQLVDGHAAGALGNILRDRLIEAEERDQPLEPGDGQPDLTIEPPAGLDGERTGADRGHVTLRELGLLDLDPPISTRQLA